jgi:hypothetical protein
MNHKKQIRLDIERIERILKRKINQEERDKYQKILESRKLHYRICSK